MRWESKEELSNSYNTALWHHMSLSSSPASEAMEEAQTSRQTARESRTTKHSKHNILIVKTSLKAPGTTR